MFSSLLSLLAYSLTNLMRASQKDIYLLSEQVKLQAQLDLGA